MKRVRLLLMVHPLAACSAPPPATPAPTEVKPRAVYLVIGQGQLAAADLSHYSEVVVVRTFGDLKTAATDTNISRWIDKHAASLADSAWLMQAPQRHNRLVLIGYNDALYAFRDILGIGISAPISGVYMDWSAVRLKPGFSVWVLQPHHAAVNYGAFMQGYDQAPTIPAIFATTDPLIGASPSAVTLSRLWFRGRLKPAIVVAGWFAGFSRRYFRPGRLHPGVAGSNGAASQLAHLKAAGLAIPPTNILNGGHHAIHPFWRTLS